MHVPTIISIKSLKLGGDYVKGSLEGLLLGLSETSPQWFGYLIKLCEVCQK